MLQHVTRSSLLFAYKVGSLCNKARLKTRFGITLQDLAARMHISTSTLWRYRMLHELLTIEQVEMLVQHMVPINALLLVASKLEKNPDVARTIFDALCRGEKVSVKDVQAMMVEELERSLLPYNSFPGAATDPSNAPEEPKQEAVIGELIDAVGTSEEEEKSPAEKIIDTVAEESSEACDDEDDYADSHMKEPDKSQQEKDARTYFQLVHTSFLPLRRNLRDISDNIMEQLKKTEEREAVMIGVPSVHEDFRNEMTDLARDCQLSLERLIQAYQWFRQGGYVERPISFPEGQSAETLFGYEK